MQSYGICSQMVPNVVQAGNVLRVAALDGVRDSHDARSHLLYTVCFSICGDSPSVPWFNLMFISAKMCSSAGVCEGARAFHTCTRPSCILLNAWFVDSYLLFWNTPWCCLLWTYVWICGAAYDFGLPSREEPHLASYLLQNMWIPTCHSRVKCHTVSCKKMLRLAAMAEAQALHATRSRTLLSVYCSIPGILAFFTGCRLMLFTVDTCLGPGFSWGSGFPSQKSNSFHYVHQRIHGALHLYLEFIFILFPA